MKFIRDLISLVALIVASIVGVGFLNAQHLISLDFSNVRLPQAASAPVSPAQPVVVQLVPAQPGAGGLPTREPTPQPTLTPLPTDVPAPAQPAAFPTALPLPTTAPMPTVAAATDIPPTDVPQPTPVPTYPAPIVADARVIPMSTPVPVAQAAQGDIQAQPQPGPPTQYTARLLDGENNGLVATYTYQVCQVAGVQGGLTCELAGAHGVANTFGGRCNAYWTNGDPAATTLILTNAPWCQPGGGQ